MNIVIGVDDAGDSVEYLADDKGRRIAEIVAIPSKFAGGVPVGYSIDIIPLAGGSLEHVVAFGATTHRQTGKRVLGGREAIDLGALNDPFFGCVVVGLPEGDV